MKYCVNNCKSSIYPPHVPQDPLGGDYVCGDFIMAFGKLSLPGYHHLGKEFMQNNQTNCCGRSRNTDVAQADEWLDAMFLSEGRMESVL